MLRPEIRLADNDTFCTCGNPNFRRNMDTRPKYDIYEVKIPTAPCGYATHFLCRNCLKIIASAIGAEMGGEDDA